MGEIIVYTFLNMCYGWCMEGRFESVACTGKFTGDGMRVDKIEFAVVGDIPSKQFKLRLRCDGRPDFSMLLSDAQVVEMAAFFDHGCDTVKYAEGYFKHFARNYKFKNLWK